MATILILTTALALGFLLAGILQAAKPTPDDRPIWVATQGGWVARKSSKHTSPPARTARR